ncbi:brca2 and cdkn1a-interacting protein [Anaeramoeba flamelloides]|uniref:Brca2 and cdkn1a-interacting protein n=1 Tax=Anaeramoeba flamelloides TaxID=1746091 RepID=A0AAV7YIF3_9EUKA|nr:brca2 and cdkn1a-interacting protein [Anaeramoeba flamelloides]
MSKRSRIDEKQQEFEDTDTDSTDNEEEMLEQLPSTLPLLATEKSEKTINVDFEFFDPKQGDQEQIAKLLANYLPQTKFDLEGITNFIVSQTRVGTVVKIEQEDVIGFVSVININTNRSLKCVEQILEYLEKNLDQNFKEKLDELLQNEKANVGLILDERLVNCPHILAPHIMRAIFDEINWATEDEPTKELQNSFKFDYILNLTRCFVTVESQNEKENETKNKNLEVQWPKIEDEFLMEQSEMSSFWLPEKEIESKEFHISPHIEKKICMLIPMKRIDKMRTNLNSLFNLN